MRHHRRLAMLLSTLLLLGFSLSAFAQGGRAPYAPVVVETAWGQHVVPDLWTYLDMQVYAQLKPGEKWSAGDAIRKKVYADYQAGRLKLRRFPWKVVEGIYALGRDDQGQLTYLLDTGEGLLLIDPSYDSWQDDLLQEIRQLGYDSAQVHWVLLTHCHVDHAQSAHSWRERGAKILIGDGDAHAVESGNQLVAAYGAPEGERHFTPCLVDQHVYDGDVLKFGRLTLYAISTPGHTPGSTCFYLDHAGKHLLFSGDVVLHAGRHAWMGNPYADWEQYYRSLHKLAPYAVNGQEVHFDILLPGHGTVDMDDASRSVDETIRIVGNIIARRNSGEKIDWIDPYPWLWEQGILYRDKKPH
jgi:glyoxylase-like metal-dependent hydrolase (beta-lactamase superfamily II)